MNLQIPESSSVAESIEQRHLYLWNDSALWRYLVLTMVLKCSTKFEISYVTRCTVGSLYKATLYKAHFFTENRPVEFSERPYIRHKFSDRSMILSEFNLFLCFFLIKLAWNSFKLWQTSKIITQYLCAIPLI